MDGQTLGLVGGLAGSAIGVIGGMAGMYFSIKNTHGPRERAFVIRGAVFAAIAVTLFLALMFLLPEPHRHLLWIPYGIALSVGIVYSNKRQREIALEEQGEPQERRSG